MTREEGNGMEADGSTPAGAFVHPSAVKVNPVEGRIPILWTIKERT